jgi:hypothetical protein
MKTLTDYTGNLKSYPEDEQKKILNTFVNDIILDLNANLTVGEIIHIQKRVHERLNYGLSIKYLNSIRMEIISNLKRYTPFCFASIVTAAKNIDRNG